MDFISHELGRGLMIGIPILIMLGLGLLQGWLTKRNAEISAVLQRRDE
jgi:uncharacterized membrane protein